MFNKDSKILGPIDTRFINPCYAELDMIALRIEVEEKELLRRICRARGEDLSSFVRRAIRMELARLSFLSEEEKKALGWNQRPLQYRETGG
jgi:hypothetical protein